MLFHRIASCHLTSVNMRHFFRTQALALQI
jgi:hypothetical protein